MTWLKTQIQAQFLSLGLFVVLGGLLLFLAHAYEVREAEQLLASLYAKEAGLIKSKAAALIEEKKNATLALALALALSQDGEIKRQLKEQKADAPWLTQLSLYFRDHSHFKNLWIRLLGQDGKVLAQSWSANPADTTAGQPFFDRPEVELRVDSQDLGFHATSPVRDTKGHSLGSLVLISHFNSISQQLEALGYESLILVQPSYRASISQPLSKTFIEDHYVANQYPNQRLLDLLQHRGLASFMRPGAAFVLEPEQGLLVANLSLFDRHQRPLATVLMFRSAKELHGEALAQLEIRVQLMVVLGLFGLAFVLYLVANRPGLAPGQRTGASRWFFVGIFLMLSLLQLALLYWMGEQRRTEYLALRSQDVEHHFNYIKSKYEDMAQAVFQASINRPEVLDIMSRVDEDAANSRRQLLELLILDYEKFFRQQLRQLHFHLPNNKSFLRFHRPGKHGDDLTDMRPMVRWTNALQQPIHGFENGRIFSGFRSVFPLLSERKGQRQHLGSVEIAFSAFVFARELAHELGDKVGYLVPAPQVDGILFNEDAGNFVPSPIPGFYFQRETHEQLEHAGLGLNLTRLGDLEVIAKAMRTGQVFSLSDASLRQLYSFIPLENPVTRELAAVLVLQSQDAFLAERAAYFRILLGMGVLGALLISLFSWRSNEAKAHIQALLTKTQSILDAQNSIMVISDGVHLMDHNRQLLEFFGVPSTEVLKTRYACICEAFVRDDKFFHLGKVPAGVHWLAHLQQLPKREHIVSMRDIGGRPHAFALALSHVDNLYIISFSDISDTMREHFDLAERVVRDKLTGAYNREFFANRIDELIKEAGDGHLMLGFILFDIDHFKRINDSYGHARGDLVLIQLVQLAERTLRYEDILIRWGGEEFLILAQVPSIEQLIRIAENLRSQMQADNHPEVGQVTCSFGVGLYQEGEVPEAVLERADKALYRAKELGRNRVEVAL